MSFVRQVAKLARMGDLPGIQRLCEEEKLAATWAGENVLLGFADADKLTGRTPPLPQLAEPLRIGPGQPPVPSIYSEPPYRGRKKKAA